MKLNRAPSVPPRIGVISGGVLHSLHAETAQSISSMHVSMISFMFRYCSVMVRFTVPVPHFSFNILVMCCIVFLRASKDEIS